MSPLRRHGGGRPRSARSILDIAEQWGISEKVARRLAARALNQEAMALLVRDSQRYTAALRAAALRREAYPGGPQMREIDRRVPASLL